MAGTFRRLNSKEVIIMKPAGYILVITAILFVFVFLVNLPSFNKQNDDSSVITETTTEVTTTETTESAVTTVDLGSDKLPVDNEWALFLVNSDNPLPDNYVVKPAKIFGEYELDERCAEYFKNMISASRVDGVTIHVESALRTTEYQKSLLNLEIQTFKNMGYSEDDAYKNATKEVAEPGQSEHNAGVAVDLLEDGNTTLTTDFDKTDEFRWLSDNAYKYGFILRYPKDKTAVTGINYEPWHFRFVGVYNATRMKETGLCLEEYIQSLK